MQKEHYKKELIISNSCSRGNPANKPADVRKVQSWLNLFEISDPAAGTGTLIDGIYGAATENAVIQFQKVTGLKQTGIVDNSVFSKLTQGMSNAFTHQPKELDLRKLIVAVAHQHLENKPYELEVNNETNTGPWVRSYMDGFNGRDWLWCVGFLQAIVDQAASQVGKNFKSLMPLTYSCDIIGETGKVKGLLSSFLKVRSDPKVAKPGDIFLLQKSPIDYFHAGLIISIDEDTFVTIEGNTNSDGSNNGNGVYKRNRNFRKTKIDVFSIEPLVLGAKQKKAHVL